MLIKHPAYGSSDYEQEKVITQWNLHFWMYFLIFSDVYNQNAIIIVPTSRKYSIFRSKINLNFYWA